jgi:micrococcal nuclease
MSKHWNPGTNARPLRFGRARREWTRAQDYWQSTAAHRRIPDSAKAGLVLVAAACIGAGIGIYQVAGPSDVFESDPSVDWNAVESAPAEKPVETVIPQVKADPADAEWASRAGGPSSPSTGSGRTVEAVRASFGSCKWGGGTDCVVDGDTFYIGGQKVRIAGIDAPETHDYRCPSELQLGDQAASQLQALLNLGGVTMTGVDRDRDAYGRLLRNVSVNGQDVGEALIASGVAREYGSGRRSWC